LPDPHLTAKKGRALLEHEPVHIKDRDPVGIGQLHEQLRAIRQEIDPTQVIKEEVEPITSAIEAYQAFDQRRPGWITVKLEPVAVAA
jgi:hypothetical protein